MPIFSSRFTNADLLFWVYLMEHFLQENKSIKPSSQCKPPFMSWQIICLQWSKWLCPKPRTKKRKSNWRLLWSRSRQWWRSSISMWSSEVVKDRLRTIIPLSNLDQFTYKHFSQSFEATSLMFPLLTLKNLQKWHKMGKREKSSFNSST